MIAKTCIFKIVLEQKLQQETAKQVKSFVCL